MQKCCQQKQKYKFTPNNYRLTSYVKILRHLRDAVKRKRPENSLLLHYSTHAHLPLVVRKYLAKHNVTPLERLPYSSDFSPPNFFLFLQLESVLKEQQFSSPKEVSSRAIRAL
jgi:hypothetical protein